MHVLLIEDHPLIASGIISGLNAQGFTVSHTNTANHATALLEQSEVDCLILDLGLPDEDGMSLLQRLRQRGFQTPVLILSARDGVAERVKGLQIGADDYLIKPFDLRELAARLHALIRRASGRSQSHILHGALCFNPSTYSVQLSGIDIELSRRELALLQALLNNPNRILSAEQLKDAMYGFLDQVESNALNVHIHHLRKKLGNQIVQTVRGLGYRLGPAEP